MSFKVLLKYLLPLLAIIHFAFYLVRSFDVRTDTKQLEQNACLIREQKKIADLDCRHYFAKAHVQAAAVLDDIRNFQCIKFGQEEYEAIKQRSEELRQSACSDPETSYFAPHLRLPDIGWDAHGIWYARAATAYFLSEKPATDERPLWQRANITNREHRHYPWVVSAVYFGLMKLLNSASPLYLQILNVLLFLATIWLYRKTWPQAPWSIFIAFTFVPMAANFLFKLYADVWIILALLLLYYLMLRRKIVLAAFVLFIIPQIKSEGGVQAFCFLITFAMLHHKEYKFKKFIPMFLSFILSIFIYRLFFAPHKDPSFWISPLQRLENFSETLIIAKNSLGYFLDVLFRPMLWGILWPFLFYVFWKNRYEIRYALAPIALLIVVIPFSFLACPHGHKEIVLTASNRALWQLLPMAWMLLPHCRLPWGLNAHMTSSEQSRSTGP